MKKDAKKSKNDRHNFGQATRMDLAKAAGFKCSHRGCLAASTCVAEKAKTGKIGSANVGCASHIYAAADDGPRPAPAGMSPEKIMHVSNGIWLCRDCGTIIDNIECKYPAEILQEMKRVREFAQELTIISPEVRTVSRFISPIAFDDIFWDHLPELNRESITRAVLAVGAKSIGDYLDSKSKQSSPLPLSFALKSIASAVQTATAVTEQSSMLDLSVAQKTYSGGSPVDFACTHLREKAATIVDAWARSIRSRDWKGVGWHIHYCNVKLMARNPKTGELSDSFIWVQGNGYGRHDHLSTGGKSLHLHVSYTASNVNNLDWHLKIDIEPGRFVFESSLRMFGRPLFRDIDNPYVWQDFEAYERVLRKLSEGWEPIGFVGLETGDRLDSDVVYPELFEIDLHISKPEFDQALYDCAKVRLAQEISRACSKFFVFTPDYFNRALDESTIRQAVFNYRRPISTSYVESHERYFGPTVRVGRREIGMIVRGIWMLFDPVPRRHLY
ncbi:hypothetical protein GTP58_16575 [Duganella sp. CY15W]|uniref:hypothetical protein n=1 Tax=Duganella sp. CY15W TaxID=2692172 RepID=UPI00136E7686|nr:hypothetical protein [Duganella sp. CY15W]MYM29948.1 hypothetical protein [Duganella sp. CY15W]